MRTVTYYVPRHFRYPCHVYGGHWSAEVFKGVDFYHGQQIFDWNTGETGVVVLDASDLDALVARGLVVLGDCDCT